MANVQVCNVLPSNEPEIVLPFELEPGRNSHIHISHDRGLTADYLQKVLGVELDEHNSRIREIAQKTGVSYDGHLLYCSGTFYPDAKKIRKAAWLIVQSFEKNEE